MASGTAHRLQLEQVRKEQVHVGFAFVVFIKDDPFRIHLAMQKFLQKYLILVKEVHDNVEGAKSRLYSHILNDRIEYINYAYKIGGNLTAEKAEMFADDAILATMEAICNFERMITNPRGCVKSFIKGYVRESRKKKTKPLTTTKKI